MTFAYQKVREHFASLTPAEAVEVLGWLVDTGIADPDPLEDAEPVVDALLPIRDAYCRAYPQVRRALEDHAEEAARG